MTKWSKDWPYSTMHFDSSPVLYWTIGYFMAGLLIFLATKHNNQKLFLALSCLVVLFMRLPVLFFNSELNPDESQAITHTLTLLKFPLFWQSVDGTTTGPLNDYVYCLARLWTPTIDYTAIRIVSLSFLIASVLLFYLSLKRFSNQQTAQISVLPLIFFLAFTQEPDFVLATSEQLSVFLLCLALLLLSQFSRVFYDLYGNDTWSRRTEAIAQSDGFGKPVQINEDTFSNIRVAFIIGFTLGLLPFAKLQAVPSGLIFGIFSVCLAWTNDSKSNPHKTQNLRIIGLLTGAITFPVIITIYLSINHLWHDFFVFYLQDNFMYATSGSQENVFLRLIKLLKSSTDFWRLLGILFLGWGLLKNIGKISSCSIFGLLWLVVGFYSALQSGNNFVHYLNFCIYPVVFLYGLIVSRLSENPKTITLFSSLILSLWFVGFSIKIIHNQSFNQYPSTNHQSLTKSNIAKKILDYANPETDRMAIWGWACRYYVETQLPQATAESHTERAIFGSPIREAHRKRYIKNLEETQPRIFLDAVGKNSVWVQDKATQSHESFPELKKYIGQNYTYVDTIDDVRIYVLK